MNYIRDLQENPEAKPTGYWKNTSDNSIIRSFIDIAGSNITEKLEILLSGGYLKEHIDENLIYDYLHSSEENLWSVLYLTGYLTRLLRMTISYHDDKEDFYHAFLAGIFAGAGYVVQSNKEHGEGRSDIVVLDSRNGRVAVFEEKYSRILGHLENDCEKAVRQINDRMYADEFADNYDEVFCYGISFYKKRCMVKRK